MAESSKVPRKDAEPIKRKAENVEASKSGEGKRKKSEVETAVPSSGDDDEWALFQREVLSMADQPQGEDRSASSHPINHTKAASSNDQEPRSRPSHAPANEGASPDAYANATVEVAPQLNKAGDGTALEGSDGTATQFEETEAQKRRRRVREDKEEIMARLEEEQRQQDEADER